MRIRGTVLLLTGMALVGCAREDRWTLHGSPPSPIGDERSADGGTQRSAGHLPLQSIPVIDRNGVCYVQNPNAKQDILVTLLVTPSGTGTANETPKRQQVIVPAGGEIRAGITSNGSGTTWKYTKLDAVYR